MSARGWAYALTLSTVLWAVLATAAALILRGIA